MEKIPAFDVVITGEMPLLMHHDSIEGREEVQGWIRDPANKKKSVKGDDRTPPWTWRTYLYTDGKHVTMLSDNVRRVMSQGATDVLVGKGQKTWKEESVSRTQFPSEHLKFEYTDNPDDGWRQASMVQIMTVANMPLFSDQCAAAKKLGFVLDCRPVRVGTTKHIRVRPKFAFWRISFVLRALDERITRNVVQQWFDVAGKKGLCDNRPSSPKTPGYFGTFRTVVEEV